MDGGSETNIARSYYLLNDFDITISFDTVLLRLHSWLRPDKTLTLSVTQLVRVTIHGDEMYTLSSHHSLY